MKQINDNNIDEIMFRLLEGEITGSEREQLLDAIASDEKYSRLWNTWQQTIVSPGYDIPTMETGFLKKKGAGVFPLFMRYAVAAMLIIALGITLYFVQLKEDRISGTDSGNPLKPKVPVIQVPKPESKAITTPEDTIMPVREKIRHMARSLESRPIIPDLPFNGGLNNVSPFKTLENEIVVIEDKKKEVPKMEITKPEEAGDADSRDEILVSITSENKSYGKSGINVKKQSLLARLFGTSKIKIENDKSTRTQKRIVIENNKYQIIAGF